MKLRLLAAALLVTCLACGGGPNFTVTPEQIGRDLATKSISVDGVGQWSFAADESRRVKIVETKKDGNGVAAVVEVVTESKVGLGKMVKMGGRLRLHYEMLADQWNLTGVENISFKPL